MRTIIAFSMIAAAALSVVACGGSFKPPTDRLASSEAAIRSARELGAEQNPQAALHVRLADEQIQSARKLMNDGENKRADLILQRASSDAELAVMLTREQKAKGESDKAKGTLQGVQQGGTTSPTVVPPQQPQQQH
jgi:hypothetical protein